MLYFMVKMIHCNILVSLNFFFFFRFTINVLLDKIPDLGLVIDLTHTTKYYNKRVSSLSIFVKLLYNQYHLDSSCGFWRND